MISCLDGGNTKTKSNILHISRTSQINQKVLKEYPFNICWLIWDVRAEEANPDTPKTHPSHSWGRFLAHTSQIHQKVLKRYQYGIESGLWGMGESRSRRSAN
jgi:hypothetical protein